MHKKQAVSEAHIARHQEIVQNLDNASMENGLQIVRELEAMLKELDFKSAPEFDLNILMDIGIYYGQAGDRESAERYFQKIIALAKRRSMQRYKNLAESNLAIIKISSGKYPEAIGLWQKQLATEEDEGVKQHLLNNISVAYGIAGNYNEAINYAYQALDLAQKLRRKDLYLAPYINLSKAYEHHQEKDKALDYVLKALDLAREINDIHALIQCLNNACVILNELDRNDEALVYARENLELRLQYLSTHEHGMAYNNLGVIYKSIGDYQAALDSFQHGLTCFSPDGVSEALANSLLNIAIVYYEMNLMDDALKYFADVEPLLAELELKALYSKYYDYYGYTLKQKGRLLEAFEAQAKHNAYLKEMYQENLKISINKFEAEYYRKHIQTQAEAYKKQNRELKRKRKELNIANKHMKETVEALNWLVSVISHDVRAPLANFGQILDMALAGDFKPEEIPEILGAIQNSSIQIYDLVNEMLDGIRLQRRRISDSTNNEKQDLLPILHQISMMYQPIALHKGLKFAMRFDSDEMFAEVDADLIKIVVRNLLNNAIKFTPAGGVITLSAELVDGIPEIYISDTGKGMSPSELNKILKQRIPNSQKTLEGGGIGLGLSLCRDAIKKMKGSMHIVSSPGIGTTISLSLSPAEQGKPRSS